ncbi:MAG: hypothetical protein OSA98_10220, partial [Rubripirellula sp.]|nr:hypothetical protein [Rubripirellula sp.]
MKLRTKNSSSRRLRTKNSLRAVRRRKRVGLERLEPRLLLAVCADGTDPLSGDYIQNDLDAPYVVNAQLCYQGDISLSSDGSVTVNAEIFSATGDVTIDSDDSVTVNAEVTAETGDIDVTADAAITINSSLTSGEAIEVTGHKTIEVYADIISDGGEVTIEAVHKRLNFGISALDQIQDLLTLGSGQLEVTIGSESDEVLISGAEGVSITAEAGINDEYNIGANPYYKNIMPVFLELIGKPDLFSLPLSVQVWNPIAEVTATNAKIISDDGEVTVSAVAEANAKGKAVWNRVIGTGSKVGEGLGFDKGGGAAGLFFTDATATVDVIGSVLSGDGVEVSSEVTNEIELEVSAFTNNGLSDTNPASVAIGFGLTELRTTSTVNVDENSLISSTGSVTVAASGEDDNSNSVKATAYRDGVVGAAAGFTYTDATVSAVVDGKITMSPDAASSESDSTPAILDFNPALQVDFLNSSVGFSGTPDYQTGDAVVFSSEDNGTIPGLVPDTIYYLIVTANSSLNTYQLQFAETAEDAADNEFISFGAAFPELNNLRTGVDAPITITAVDAEDRHLILFGYDQTLDGVALFEDGDTVTFMPSSGRFLGVEDESQNLVGPLAAVNYTVNTVESPLYEQYPLAIELIDTEGQPVALNSASYLESDSGTYYPISAFDMTENTVDLNTVSIDSTTNEKVATPPSIPVQQGESLVFRSGLISNVPSLQDGATYYAIVDSDNEGIIQLGLTASQAESSNPAVQNEQAYLTAMVEGQSVSIPIGNFEAGTGLVFSEDPNLADGTSVVYNAVSEKPIQGLVDQATYVAYNVSNINDNPAAPQSIVALVNTTAVDLSTNADSGSFQLTISDSQGTQGTTASIAYDATAGGLADAIDALQLAGVSVVVSGFGTAQAPWLIQGLDEDAIAVDASQLFVGASAAEVSKQTPQLGIVLGSEAVSGTFTLTITDATEQTATSAPLAWNSTPAEIENALNGLLGITVSASGMGNQLSPWRIQGVLPSQVTIDSSLLLDRFGEEVTMEMTSDLQENFWTGQTLQRNAEAFTITGSHADNNDLTLLLTEEAPVVSSDSGALQNGSVSVSAVDAGATQMFSFADGGTFTLTITDPRTGSVTTTTALDWDADASNIASAIQTATGWSVQVTGSGTLQSPWLIGGVGAQQIVVNNDNLLQGAGQTKMLYRSTAASANVVSSDADGGTFTLTFSDGTQSVESAPIPFDASAGDVNEVLRASLSSVNAEVFGLGTAQDPWVIISFAQPIQTGDAMTFHDSWDLPSLGLVNGQTYYAVVKPSALDANMVIVGLAASPADATADPPAFVTLSSSVDLVSGPPVVMTGAQESITPVPEALELEISTEVTSSDSSSSASAIGGRPMLGYYTDGAKHAKTRWFSEQSPGGANAIDHEIDERTPAHLKDKVNPFSLTFGISVLDVTNDVQTVVGNTSVIGVEGNVAITSDLKENVHSSANAGLSKQSSKDHGESTAVAIASAVALLNNSAQAVVESDAEVTGTEGVEVTSEITYPKRVKVPGSKNGGWDEAYGILKSLALNPTVNAVESWFFNTSTNVGIKGVGTDDAKRLSTILTGSFSVQDITNRNLAQIADGAQINQSLTGYSWYDTSSQTVVTTRDLGELEDTNSVVIEATSDVSQMGIAGQLYIGLDLLTLGTNDLANNLLPFRKSSRNALGGSANFVILSEQTQALLGGTDPDGNVPVNTSTNVMYGGGSEGENVGLSVTAETATTLIEIGQAAANSSGVGFEASTAYLLMGENDESDADRGQFTYAEMNTDNLPIELTPISGTAGEVVVTAEDRSDLWAVSGAVLLGATKGIGLSASVIELNREAVAGVGSRMSSGTTKATNRRTNGGDFTIDASVDGTIMPMALVGAISASRNSAIGGVGADQVPAEGGNGAASEIEGKWGLGISGDFAGAFVDDQAQAYLNSPGTISGVESEDAELGTLEISAKNESIMNPISGQATISIARGDEGAMAGIAGSASVAAFHSSVTAMLDNAMIEYLTIDLKALNEKKIGTCAAGLQVQAPKGADLQIAGSVVVNEVENTTIASISNVTQSEGLGEVSLSALQLDQIWGGAGTAAVTYDRRSERPKAKTAVGVGMSAVWNQIDNETTAEVVDSTLNQSEGVFDVSAEDFTSSRVLSAGVNVTVPAGMAIEIGGMWATNFVSPLTKALVTGSTIENAATDDAMSVDAVLAPFMDSFAGYFSLEFGKPLSTKETQLGVGVGAAVVVNRLGPKDSDGTALPTLAQVSDSTLNRLGDVTVRAFTGALDDQTSAFVPNQNLVESQVGELSLHALAIAGSAQGENSASSSFSVGVVVNGAVVVTDLKIDTQATVTTNSLINEGDSVSESTSMVEILAINQLTVSTDAGGASVSESVSLTGTSVDIAVGGADNSFNSSNQTSATIADNSAVVAESLDVVASHSPEIDNVAFGVAVSVAVSTGMFGAAIGFSGAFLQSDQSDSIAAGVSDSDVMIGDSINVQADDQSTMKTGSGAGSLQVAYGSGGSVSLAPSAVTNKVTVGNVVLAWIGQQPQLGGSLIDTGVTADGSSISAGGVIKVAATGDQTITNTAIAVAVSVAIAPDFASAAGAGAGASSTVTTNNIIKAAVNGVADLTVGGTSGLSVLGTDSGSVDIIVGTAAASIGWFGASIGISLAEIVNNDQVVAEVQNSIIQTGETSTSGMPIEIIAEDRVQLTTNAVATSLSISIGASGAGGKSNITSNANVAASFGDGSKLMAASDDSRCDLTIKASSSETLLAEIYGGTAGLGAVGVFNSDAVRSGSTLASVDTAADIETQDFSVIASTSQSVTSEGMSVTVGGLAGTGENHNVTVNESVTTDVSGQSMQWNVAGDLLLQALSGNTATAKTSGSGTDQQDVSASLMGVGFFKVDSVVSPVVTLSVSDVKFDVAGTSTFESDAISQNTTEAKSGSGSLVGGDAAKATTGNSPQVSLTLADLDLNSGTTTISGSSRADYSTSANSVYATVAGGSAARAKNNSSTEVNVSLGGNTSITAEGSVYVSAENAMSGIGDGNSLKASGFMARVGAGGGITGFGGTSASTMDGSSGIQFADAVEITANGRGNIQIGSVNQWQSNQLTHLGTGGVINGAGIQSTLESNLSNAIDIGSNVSLIAPGGEIGIGTSSNSVTTSNADSYTFGLAGGSSSDSSNNMTSKQTLTIGNSSVLHAGRDIVITTGYDPRTKTESLLDAYAIVTARCAGLLEIPGTTADAVLNADNTLSIGTGTIISHGDIEIGALPGINNASWYTFANMDGAKGKVHQGTDGLTESNSVTIDSDVYAGNNNTLSIDIPATGQQINVNGSGNQAITEEAAEIEPSDAFATSGAFLPFQVSYNSDYDATQLLAGLDDTSKAILEPSISKQSVTAVTLTDLVAVGGQVVLHAADLQGSGTITANMPSISITNESDAYLLLDGVGNANTLNMGQVNVVGGGTKPSGMTFTQNKDVPAIVVLQTYGQAVGDSTSGPAIALNDAMVNTAGSVQITNDMGALVQTAPINAQTVSISTPNSAYIVSTPADYYGSSGEIKDYWTAGTSLTQDGGFESPSTGTYVYNPPGSNWTFSSSSGVSANDSGFTSGNPSAPQGDQVAFLQMQGEISQSMGSMTGGATYVLQFDSAQRAGYPDQSFDIALDGNQLCQITPTSTDYESYSCTFEVPTTELANQDTLVLTDGLSSTATAFWHQDQLELPTSGSIAIDFTYQSGGNKEADGIALAFQTQGVDVIGAVGGSLGYVGIPGPTAAYQINLYNGHVQGSNFVTTNTSETYLETSPVSFNSGNPIRVQLVYDVDTSVVTESLTDLATNATFTRTYENVDLRSVLGSKTYVGFTGGDGGATSTQTVSDFSLTVGDADQTPVMQGFGNWEINGDVNRVLTLTGLEPTGQDETVFLDNMVLATNPDGFMPGLNSYVQEYTANLAATTAANDLYLEESGASFGLQFSSWLYNQGGQSINMNYNVSPGSIGSDYPRKANDNFDSEQHGNGTIFFGSEIPYLWNQATSVSSGSGYLYLDLGYLDNLSNAQTYSVQASGNSLDEYKNVTQGTGPQKDDVSPGRGVFPVVPASFPTSVSVSEPGSRSLGGSGITAGSLDVTALFLDINGPIKVGALKQSIDLVLGSNLQDSMDSYQQDFKSGSITSPTMDLDTYFGTSGMTGYFDASSGEIVINPYAVTAGLAKAVFTGAIISTTGLGEITVQSDPGEINIDNQTDYPLVLENISAASQELGGVVLLNDTITNTATGFVYSTDESVRVYQGELHSDLDSMTLVTTTTGDAISFQPGSDQPYVAGSVSPSSLAYQWTTDAWISRELTFNVNSSGGYDLTAGSTGDAWHWGRLRGASQNAEVESSPFPSVNTVLLSDGQADDSNAYWHPTKLDVPETGQFTVQFTYQASGDKAADGITFAFQNEGANALGGVGGALGYVGISGPTAAYQINLYSGHTQGSNFIVTNASGTYLTTDEVSFNDGNPVEVTLVYDGDAKTVSESLTDTVTLATYTHVYDNIDLTAVLGASSYFGFTGGDGGATSIQTVSDFSLTLGTSSTPQVKDFALWNGLYHQDVVSLSTSGMENSNALQSVTAIITQSESATTTFSGDNSDAWNYGPSTTWDWSYPTEILLRNFNQVPAANPISIDFSGVQYGSLTVESDADLRLAGNIIFPGTVSLSSAENVTQVPNAVVNATRVDFTSSEGSIGQEGLPIQVSVDSSSVINANASDGIYLSSKNELVLGQIITSSGQVGLESDGDLTAGEGNSMIAGDNISLMAENGSIGSQARPLTIQTKTSQLESGTVIGGLLSAAAKDSVFVVQPESDLRLLSVTTSSSLGVVSITNQSGSITDGNTSDVFELNQFTLEQAEFLIQQINIVQQNTAETTVTAFEAAVDQSYLQYWTMVPSQGAVDEQTGEFVLNADGLAYYKAQAALYYAAESGDESPGPVTDEQIQSYGNLLYQNSVAVFADSLVFGNAWPTLSQFQSYDPDYTYEVSSGVRDTLTYGANDLSNSLAILSLDALSPVGTAVLGPISPAIQTTVLDLNAGGAIGVPFHVLEIDYSDFQDGTLNDEEVAVLAQATSSGELRFVGVNPSGERVEYFYGSRPDGVTPEAVIIRIDKPLIVDLAVNGLVQVQAQESINLTEAVGDLNVMYAEAPYAVKLVS